MKTNPRKLVHIFGIISLLLCSTSLIPMERVNDQFPKGIDHSWKVVLNLPMWWTSLPSDSVALDLGLNSLQWPKPLFDNEIDVFLKEKETQGLKDYLSLKRESLDDMISKWEKEFKSQGLPKSEVIKLLNNLVEKYEQFDPKTMYEYPENNSYEYENDSDKIIRRVETSLIGGKKIKHAASGPIDPQTYARNLHILNKQLVGITELLFDPKIKLGSLIVAMSILSRPYELTLEEPYKIYPNTFVENSYNQLPDAIKELFQKNNLVKFEKKPVQALPKIMPAREVAPQTPITMSPTVAPKPTLKAEAKEFVPATQPKPTSPIVDVNSVIKPVETMPAPAPSTSASTSTQSYTAPQGPTENQLQYLRTQANSIQNWTRIDKVNPQELENILTNLAPNQPAKLTETQRNQLTALYSGGIVPNDKTLNKNIQANIGTIIKKAVQPYKGQIYNCFYKSMDLLPLLVLTVLLNDYHGGRLPVPPYPIAQNSRIHHYYQMIAEPLRQALESKGIAVITKK